jgi:putative oxidoreductase
MKLGTALLRMTVGGLFIGHGTQKLFGWFGGHGIEGTGAFFEQLGLRPGRQNAIAAGAAEAGGGTLLALGLFTPLASALLTGTMATAVRLVHFKKGPWVSDGGYEYNLVLLGAAFALTDAGPGAWSLDAARGRERWGAGWALAQLAAGLAGSTLAIEASQRLSQQQDQQETDPAPAVSADEAASSNGQPVATPSAA